MTTPDLAIRGTLTADGAVEAIRPYAGPWQLRAERKLYYPYFWFHLCSSVRTLFGRSSLDVSCLVDSRTGLGSTADPFALEPIEDRGEIVAPRLTLAAARNVARRYVRYVTGMRRKALTAPKLDAVDERLVHKPFWIVTGTRRDATAWRVLVDGVTGRFHALSQRPRHLT